MTDRPDGPPGFDFGFATSGSGDAELAHLRERIAATHRADEATTVRALAAEARLGPDVLAETQTYATRLAEAVRAERSQAGGVDALMLEFSLDSREGVALMCVAEALLRIPDAATRDRLIRDKIGGGDWRAHVGASPSLFVNAAAWGLLVTGKLVDTRSEGALEQALASLLRKGGEPLIRKGVNLAMRLLGRQFVTGRTIDEALANAREREAKGYTYSFDMLGEAALTAADAARYFDAYEAAIHAIGRASAGRGVVAGPGVSVKLSALHPRYHRAQRERVMVELVPRLVALAQLAKRYDIGLAIDAEEADRLDLSLDLLAVLAADPTLADWEGLGFVVQCYQKRARPTIDWIVALARKRKRRLMLRLVKGAYWDSEIKRAQVDGMPGYPVFTRKVYTDVAYLACAKAMLAAPDALYPQFASHNAFTIAAIRTLAGDARYEFQCLHGMGESIYDRLAADGGLDRACRIYAPVGSHETLLAYLVRRLLENGANSSFVNRIVDPAVSIAWLVEDPVALAARTGGAPHANLPSPAEILPGRRNSQGVDLADDAVLHALARELAATFRRSTRPARSSPAPRPAPLRRRRSSTPPIAATWSGASRRRRRRTSAVRSPTRAARARHGHKRRWPNAPRASSARPNCSKRGAQRSSRSPCAKPARRSATRSPRCARRSTSCAITLAKRARSRTRRRSGRWSRSRRGIFRSRSSRVRSARRSPRATRCSRSRRSRRR